MAKFLDGIQTIDDVIPEFITISSGTITVGTNQYPQTPTINKPGKVNRNYILVFSNKSGQTISTVTPEGFNITNNIPLPNTTTGNSVFLRGALTPSNGANNIRAAIDLTSEEPNIFVMGACRFTFNLAAAPTSGTIDWALIGY